MKYDIKNIEHHYESQFQIVDALANKSIISLSDLQPLSRIGKCRLINMAWIKLTPEAKTALLHDEHHFVRSCALLA